MSTDRHHIEIGGIAVEVVRKDIKNLHIGVYPPGGRVRVAAPVRMNDDAIRLAMVTRLDWIRRERRGFEAQCRQSEREMSSGESHYFQGQRYLLEVVERGEGPTVRLAGNTKMVLGVRPKSSQETRRRVLEQWYRRELQVRVPALLAKWEPKVGVSVSEVRIRRMRTLWGSCNPAARRVWLNLELAKKPPLCVEYVLVHEMVHLLEPHHTQRFRDLLGSVMPSWRLHRDVLNRAPLAHEEWKY